MKILLGGVICRVGDLRGLLGLLPSRVLESLRLLLLDLSGFVDIAMGLGLSRLLPSCYGNLDYQDYTTDARVTRFIRTIKVATTEARVIFPVVTLSVAKAKS